MFLTASNTPSLREKKIWQNEQTLWPHIYTTNVEIRRLWHDIPRCFAHFLEKQIFLLKHRKCKVCLPFQLLEIETGRQSNCFSYSTSGWESDRLVGVIIVLCPVVIIWQPGINITKHWNLQCLHYPPFILKFTWTEASKWAYSWAICPSIILNFKWISFMPLGQSQPNYL